MMPRIFPLTLLACACALSADATAQDRVSAALDSLPKIRKIEQVSISPDGMKVAYIVEGELSVSAIVGGEVRRISGDPKLPARDAAWSADSKQLVWLADLPGEVPASQLWTASADGSDT